MALEGDRGRTEYEQGWDTNGQTDTPGGYVAQAADKVAAAVLGKDTSLTQRINLLTVGLIGAVLYIIFKKK